MRGIEDPMMQDCTQQISFNLLPWPAMGSPLHGHPGKLHGEFSVDSRLLLLTKWISVCMPTAIVLTLDVIGLHYYLMRY